MIYIVTGAARSGKSMIMQMLRAGGIELSYDENYLGPSSFNENGFFEYEKPGDMLCDPDFRAAIDGKAISVVAHELFIVPFASRSNMKVIWVQRPLEKLHASMQHTFREGVLGGWNAGLDWKSFLNIIGSQLEKLPRELKTFHAHIEMEYDDVIYRPRQTAAQLAAFTGKKDFDIEAAGRVPKARLCHF